MCTAIWLGLSARETVSKVLGLHLPIFTFVLLGFEHVGLLQPLQFASSLFGSSCKATFSQVVVNMFYVPIGILSGADVSVGRYIARSMVPSFIGNGAPLVSLGSRPGRALTIIDWPLEQC